VVPVEEVVLLEEVVLQHEAEVFFREVMQVVHLRPDGTRLSSVSPLTRNQRMHHLVANWLPLPSRLTRMVYFGY